MNRPTRSTHRDAFGSPTMQAEACYANPNDLDLALERASFENFTLRAEIRILWDLLLSDSLEDLEDA